MNPVIGDRLEDFRHTNGDAALLRMIIRVKPTNGAKVVTEAQANAWLASQMKADRRVSTGPVAPSQPTKTVAIPGFGNVRISLVAPGKFYGLVSDEEAGALPVGFDVVNGRVVVVEVSNGLRARRAALEGALQSALRV